MNKLFLNKKYRLLILWVITFLMLLLFELQVINLIWNKIYKYEFSFKFIILLGLLSYFIVATIDLLPIILRKFAYAIVIFAIGSLTIINKIYISLKGSVVTISDTKLIDDGAGFMNMTRGLITPYSIVLLIALTLLAFTVQYSANRDIKYRDQDFRHKVLSILLSVSVIFGINLIGVGEKNLNSTYLANNTSSINASAFYDMNKKLYLESGSGIKSLEYYDYAEGDLHGIFKDKNVVFILAESLGHNIIDEELHPTLHKMKENSIVFEEYTPQTLGTGESEYHVLTGLSPSEIDWDDPKVPKTTLPNVFNDEGYHTLGGHNNLSVTYTRDKTYAKYGFDETKFVEDYDLESNNSGALNAMRHKGPVTLHIDDYEFMKEYKNEIPKDEKFFTYLLTVSSHAPYDSDLLETGGFPNREKMYESVKKARKLYPENDETYNNYLGLIASVDRAVEELSNELKKDGTYEDTVFVILGDHYPYGLDQAEYGSRFGGKIGNNRGGSQKYVDSFENEYDKYNVDFFIYSPGLEGKIEIEEHTNSVDVPVILSYLFGIENKFQGDNVFDTSVEHYNDMKGANEYSVEYKDLYYDGVSFECINQRTKTPCDFGELSLMEDFKQEELDFISNSDYILKKESK